MNDDYSQFFDQNSQICLNEESFVQTPQGSQQIIIPGNGSGSAAIATGTQQINNQRPDQIILQTQNYSMTGSAAKGSEVTKTLTYDRVQHVRQTSIGQIMVIQEDQDERVVVPEIPSMMGKKAMNSSSSDNAQQPIQLKEVALEIDISEIHEEANNSQFPSKVEMSQQELKQSEQAIPVTAAVLQASDFNNISSNHSIASNNVIKIEAEQPQQSTQNSVISQQPPKPAANPASTWQKVSFAKRRTSNNNLMATTVGQGESNNKNQSVLGKSAVSSIHSKMLMKQNTVPAKAMQSDAIEMVNQQTLAMKKKKSIQMREAGEPLPVFDCLFCCQEHFVLSKMNERSLIVKYAVHLKYFECQRNSLMIGLLMFTNINAGGVYTNDREVPVDLQQEVSGKFEMPDVIQSQNALKGIGQVVGKAAKPKVYKLQQVLDQMQKAKEIKQVKQGQQPKQQELVSQKDEHFFGGLSIVNNSLLQESQFANINFRTRRQKILQQISFESDYHNIYDPCYTSQEEEDSVNLENTESEDASCFEQEDEVSNSQEDYDSEEVSDNEDESHELEDDEEEELKEVVNEYQRSEERKKKVQQQLSPQCIQQIQYVHTDDAHGGDQSISSIEQQTDDDDDGFDGSDTEEDDPATQNDDDEAETTPLTNINNPLSFINATTSGNGQSNNLNIQENTISKEEEDDSERYTFGCVTPKGEDDMGVVGVGQHKVTFSSCQGDNSLSPVRASITATVIDKPLQVNQVRASIKKGIQSMSQSSQQNALLLDISPVSCNNTKQKSYIGDGNNTKVEATRDADYFMNINSMNEGEATSLRGKLDFYPSQEIDSLDIHITSAMPVLVQQKSQDDASDFFNNQNLLSKTVEDDLVHQLHLKRQSQYQKSYQSEAQETYQQHVMNQYYNNHSAEQQQTDMHFTAPLQSQSFTTTASKFKHQRLIPSQVQLNNDGTPQNKQNKNITVDSQKSFKTQFLFKQEQFNEILKKAKQLKSNKQLKNMGNPHHLQSYDSMQKYQMKHTQSLNDEDGQGLYKQKTQAICTPIDTNDQIMLTGFGLPGQQSKTNKTTVNQNSRRQGSNNLGGMFLGGTCKNGINSQSNILMLGDNNGVAPLTNLFTNRNTKNDLNSTKNISTVKQNQKKTQNHKLSDTVMPLLLAYPEGNQVQHLEVKSTKQFQSKQQTSSPNIMNAQFEKNFTTHQATMPNQINVNHMSKKDINQILKTALCSGRYSSTPANPESFNALVKQSKEKTIQGGDLLGKSNQKKKKKVKQGSIKNQTITNADIKKATSVKTKKGTKKSKNSKQSLQNQSNQYGQNQQSQADLQAYINICNSMNFSNDYSIPSILSGTTNQPPMMQKQTSMNSGHHINKSSQNPLMYLSMHDSKFIINNGVCNSTNIQDTSNNYPYGSSLQAEMSTCISNGGCNSNQITQLQPALAKHNLSDTRGLKKQQDAQKLNGSIDEVTLYNLLSGLNHQQKEMKNGRASISVQRSQNFAPQESVERLITNRIETEHRQPGQGHHPGQFSFSQNNMKLNQTANLNTKTDQSQMKLKKGKGSMPKNLASTNSTLKNTSVQNKRRDNQQRTRSSSKISISNAIKNEFPSHQLLIQNSMNMPQQIKNKQILLHSNPLYTHQTVAAAPRRQDDFASKPHVLNKNAKNMLIQSSESLHHDNTSQTRQQKNQSRVSNKSIHDKMPQPILAGLTSYNPKELSKFYGTSKILMSHVTSPLRPMMANDFQSAIPVGQSLNIGQNERNALGFGKGGEFATFNAKELKQ